MTPLEMLQRQQELKQQAQNIAYQIELIEGLIKEYVIEQNAPLSAFGVVAWMKPGRKTINHEKAVMEQMDEYSDHGMHSLGSALEATIERFSTTKTTVKWAEVTQAARIDTAPFTVEAPAVFVIEPVK